MPNQKRSKFISSLLLNGLLAVICLAWTIPTFGLLVSSFRDRININSSGWWAVLPHLDWVEIAQLKPDANIDRNGPMTIGGVTGTFEDFQKGINGSNGQLLTWIGNRRIGSASLQHSQLLTMWNEESRTGGGSGFEGEVKQHADPVGTGRC